MSELETESEEFEEIEDLDTYEEEIKKKHLEEQQKIIDEFVNAKDKKRAKTLETLKETDQYLRTGLSLILNYYAEHQEFNQTLLEDVIPIIAQRSKILRKIK